MWPFRHFLALLGVAAITLAQDTVVRRRDTYVGAVVQYMPLYNGSTGSKIDQVNTLSYEKIVEYAKSKNVDIIVFPEGGMTPIPGNKIIPSKQRSFTPYRPNKSNYDEFDEDIASYSSKYRAFYKNDAAVLDGKMGTVLCDLRDNGTCPMEQLGQLSCYALRNKIYIVANHYERVDCQRETDENCPDDDFYFYSMSVVFDREGRLIARYRKSTKFDEPWIDVPSEPEMVTFTTDFGVTFGLLVGFDIMEPKITEKYAANINVTAVLLSTSTFELPFMTSARDQVDWAKRANVHLLVAGYGWDGDSGIYLGENGPFGKFAPNNDPNTIFWNTIPIKSTKNSSSSTKWTRPAHPSTFTFNKTLLPIYEQERAQLDLLPRNWTLQAFAKYGSLAIEPLNVSQGSVDKIVCAGIVCCHFQVDMKLKKQPEPPNAALFNGYSIVALQTTYKLTNGSLADIELCAVMACADGNPEHCGKRRTKHSMDTMTYHQIVFTKITVERLVSVTQPVSFFTPLAFSEDTFLNDTSLTFVDEKSNQSSTLTANLTKPQSNVIVFGINGRVIRSPVEHPMPKFVSWKNDWTLVIIVLILTAVCLVVAILVLLMKNRYPAGKKRQGGSNFTAVSTINDSEDLINIPSGEKGTVVSKSGSDRDEKMIPMKVIPYNSSPTRLRDENTQKTNEEAESSKPLLQKSEYSPIMSKPPSAEPQREANKNVAPASAFPPYKSTEVKSSAEPVFGTLQRVQSKFGAQDNPRQPSNAAPKIVVEAPTEDKSEDRTYVPLSETHGIRFPKTGHALPATPFNSREALKDVYQPIYGKKPARPPPVKSTKPPMPLPADVPKSDTPGDSQDVDGSNGIPLESKPV